MIITGTMDAAVKAEKIGRHKLAGINLTEGTTATPAPGDDDEEEATGFVFITDAQVATLAGGVTVTAGTGRRHALRGLGVAAWPPPRPAARSYVTCDEPTVNIPRAKTTARSARSPPARRAALPVPSTRHSAHGHFTSTPGQVPHSNRPHPGQRHTPETGQPTPR